MIKVNLLRTKVDTNVMETKYQAPPMGGVGGGQGEQAIKLLVLGVFIGIVMFYESSQVDKAQEQMSMASQELSEVTATFNAENAKVPDGGSLQKEIDTLEEKLRLLSEMSKRRLLELKSLDFLQGIMPSRVWLERVSYNNSKVFLSGGASSDDDLTTFLEKLENGSYYKDVILLTSIEKKVKQGTVKSFKISAILRGPK